MAQQPIEHTLMRVDQLFTRKAHEQLAPRPPHPKVKDPLQKNFNGRLALWITNNVGTMWCAYIFAVIGLTGVVGALTNNTTVVLIIASVSGYFLQLVLLPIIIVGQNLQSEASDRRAESTYKDAEAILNECVQLQAHLQAQDKLLDDIMSHFHAGQNPAPATG
ncbi:MAG: hypothetical protein ACREN2_01355 [Candidatus Dormibacteria bacterium]